MAKGRRLPIIRSERFLGGYGYGQSHDSNDNNGLMEFGEEDVWSSAVDDGGGERTDESSGEWHSVAAHESVAIRGRLRIPRGEGHVEGLSFAFEDSSNGTASHRIVFRGSDGAAAAGSPRPRHVATSAPVNVPDWSKIYRVNSVESMQESSSEGVDVDGELEMIPPHEYVARSKKSGGASVFEGVGRTLKGRDLRRVRDAVWRQTGFDG